MPEPTDPAEARKDFLDASDAEIVDGPAVVADKVSGAIRDADRFGLPHVKPPLEEALDRTKGAGADAIGKPAAQDALSGKSAAVDEGAGSADALKPTEKDPA